MTTLGLGIFIYIIIVGGGCSEKKYENKKIVADGYMPENGISITDEDWTKSYKEHMQLNDRQKRILKEMGLSTNFKELTDKQIANISRIEEILQYLDKKYNKEFEYAGYVEKSALEDEYLLAYSKDGNKNTEIFKVECSKNKFTDDYLNLLIRPVYENKMYKRMKCIVKNADLKIYSTIYESDITKVDFGEEDVTKNTKSSTMIFLSSENLNTEDYDSLYGKVKLILMKNQFSGNFQLLIYKKEYFNKLNREIYYAYLDENYYLYRKTINI